LDLFRLIFQLFNQSSFIGFSGLKGEFEQCDYIDGYLQSKITYDEIIVIFDWHILWICVVGNFWLLHILKIKQKFDIKNDGVKLCICTIYLVIVYLVI